jgi:hypothetical protein
VPARRIAYCLWASRYLPLLGRNRSPTRFTITIASGATAVKVIAVSKAAHCKRGEPRPAVTKPDGACFDLFGSHRLHQSSICRFSFVYDLSLVLHFV